MNHLNHSFILIMGVSGSGKTTIGSLVANTLGINFYDADQFHPEENKKKMKSSIPLSDEDRLPWLNLLATNIPFWLEKGSFVLACSALKQHYRKILVGNKKMNTLIVHLKGDQDLIKQRILQRVHAFMPVQLLNSQFQDLEEDCNAITINIQERPEQICQKIIDNFHQIKF